MYNLTLKIYEDIDNGKVLIDAFDCPELFQYRGSPKTREMKIYKENPPPPADESPNGVVIRLMHRSGTSLES
jgi:hypothetical protein